VSEKIKKKVFQSLSSPQNPGTEVRTTGMLIDKKANTVKY